MKVTKKANGKAGPVKCADILRCEFLNGVDISCGTTMLTKRYRVRGGIGIVEATLCELHRWKINEKHPEWKFIQVSN